jgi:hypothetical protein
LPVLSAVLPTKLQFTKLPWFTLTAPPNFAV